MLRSKFMKVIVVGFGLTVALSTAAFAEEQSISPDVSVSSAAAVTAPAVKPLEADAVSSAMYQKQSSIDKYLFDEHKAEIAAQGIIVTHTAAGNDFVEVGITPFTKENEAFIYKALGSDQVKVVEGYRIMAYDGGAANGEDGLMYAAGAADAVNSDDGMMYATGAADAAVTDDGTMHATGAPTDEEKVVLAPADAQIYTATAAETAAKDGAAVSVPAISAVLAAILLLLGGIIFKTRRVRTAGK